MKSLMHLSLRVAAMTAALSAATLVVATAQHDAQALHPPPAAPESVATVTLNVDASDEHQRFDGFGAAHMLLWYEGQGDVLGNLRGRALDAVYRQVHLTMGAVDPTVLESPGNYDRRRNDNDDPFAIDLKGFQTATSAAFQRLVMNRPEASAFEGGYPAPRINVRWASPWMAPLRAQSYDAYLDEAAEQVLVSVRDWRDRYGSAPTYAQLFNEPTSGNGELSAGKGHEVVDLIKRIGERLQNEGFGNVRFIVPGEATVGQTIGVARAILDDPQARSMVGAIAYHPYPYESPYVNIPRLLATSGEGHPDAESLRTRHALRDLARRVHLPVWMTEVSHGNVDVRSFDALRGRAIHIHDEFVHADASAYFGMQSMWDIRSHEMHFGSKARFYIEEGAPVLVDQDRKAVIITGMGRAMGHYARWLTRGAVRLETSADDERVLTTAFRDDGTGRLVLVVINNRRGPTDLRVHVSNLRVSNFKGERSTAEAQWAVLDRVDAGDGQQFSVLLPALSVTTLSGELMERVPSDERNQR